jgi:hypothetical protein
MESRRTFTTQAEDRNDTPMVRPKQPTVTPTLAEAAPVESYCNPHNPEAKVSSSSFALAGTSSAALLKLSAPLGPITRVCGLIVQL